MTERTHADRVRNDPQQREASAEEPTRQGRARAEAASREPGNMHAGVDETYDMCVCEPEPRWRSVADERERNGEGP